MDLFKRAANKCGVNDFKCGTCKKCRKDEDDRWNKIWEEKFSAAERRYYQMDPLLRLSEYSPSQSSLATNEPIEDWDAFLPTARRISERQRADGRSEKRRNLKALLSV